MAAATTPNATPQPLSSASTLSERTPDAEAGCTRTAYAVHAYAHESTDAVVAYDEDNDDERRDGPRRTMRKVSRRVLPLAAAAYGISAVEKVNISLAADGIMKDLKLSASVFALASSLYFVPYGLLPVPCSLLAKRAGVRIGLASMCLAFGLVAMSTAGVQNAASLMAMRLALGATEAGVFPFVSYIISLFFGTCYMQ